MIKTVAIAIDTAISTSSEIIKRIPDLPEFIDRADYALKLMAEGKLNLAIGTNKNLEIDPRVNNKPEKPICISPNSIDSINGNYAFNFNSSPFIHIFSITFLKILF